MEEIKAKVRAFHSRFFRDRDLRDDEDIFDLGFINSLFAMQLVLFVEKEFNVAIENEDLDIENFKSINATARLIEKKTASAVGA